MNPTTRTKLITVGILIAGTILAVGDKVTNLPLPGWMTSSWPFVYSAAILFDRIAHVLWPDVIASTTTATVSLSTTGPAINSGSSFDKPPFNPPTSGRPPVAGPNAPKL